MLLAHGHNINLDLDVIYLKSYGGLVERKKHQNCGDFACCFSFFFFFYYLVPVYHMDIFGRSFSHGPMTFSA